MDVPYPSEAVRNARVPISHAHIQYGRLQTYYWYTLKLLTFQRSNKSQTRKINMSFCLTSVSDEGYKTFAGAKVQQIFDICKFI